MSLALETSRLLIQWCNVSTEAGFPTRQLFKMAFGGMSPSALERCLNNGHLITDSVHIFTGIELAIAVNGKVDNAEVNADSASGVVRRGFGSINRNRKVKDIISDDKVALLDDTVNSGFLISANPDGDNQSAVKGKNGNFIQTLPGENTLVIDHCRMWFEEWFDRAVSLVGFGHLTDSPNSHLGGKSEFPRLSISGLLKAELVSCFEAKGCLSDIVTCLVKSLHRLKKRFVLFFIGGKFNHQCLLHVSLLGLYVSLQ